jgi:pyridoxine/pyridoxamine 5'-phosphate oxidase
MNSETIEPIFYDDLGLSFAHAWDLIEEGAAKRTAPAHTPVVATVDGQGVPQLRVMVLRFADRTMRKLRFHTDARSTKAAEIAAGQTASVLIYDPLQKLQLRLVGQASIASDGPDVDSIWRESTTFARRCYMAENAPGSQAERPTSGLPGWVEGRQPLEAELADCRENFALLWFEVRSLEWLFLANKGHRRARWEWQPEAASWSGRWLVP